MAIIKPFKVKNGLDVSNSRIINLADPVEDSDAATKSYVDSFLGQTESAAFVYALNVSTLDADRPAFNTYKNGMFVETSTIVGNAAKIRIRFNRPLNTLILPDIKYAQSSTSNVDESTYTSLFTEDERLNLDYSLQQQNLTNGQLTILNLDYIQTFEFEFIIQAPANETLAGYHFIKNNNFTYSFQIFTAQPSMILNASFVNPYGSLSELPNGASLEIAIDANEGIQEVEVEGAYFVPSSQSFAGDTTVLMPVAVANAPSGTDTPESAYFRVRVKNSNNVWSDWYDSQTAGSIDGFNFVYVNDTAPTFEGESISYSNAPYIALNLFSEDGSYADISLSSVNFLGGGNVVAEAINGSGLLVEKLSNTSFIAKANASDVYLYDTNTVRLTATRASNGKASTLELKVNVATKDMVLNNLSTSIFRSSPDSSYKSSFSLSSSQVIFSHTAALDYPIAGITLAEQGQVSGANINGLQLVVLDSAAKGTFTNLLKVNATGISGRAVTKYFDIINKGFIPRTLTNVNLLNPAQIPTVSDSTKVLVQVGDNANLIACIYNSSGSAVVGFQGDGNNQINEFYIYSNAGSWYLVFDNNVIALANQGGWVNSARIVIEELI